MGGSESSQLAGRPSPSQGNRSVVLRVPSGHQRRVVHGVPSGHHHSCPRPMWIPPSPEMPPPILTNPDSTSSTESDASDVSLKSDQSKQEIIYLNGQSSPLEKSPPILTNPDPEEKEREIEAQREKIRQLKEEMEEMKRPWEDMEREIERLREIQRQLEEEMAEMNGEGSVVLRGPSGHQLKEMKRVQEKLIERIRQLKKEMEEIRIDREEKEREIETLRERIRQLEEEMEEMNRPREKSLPILTNPDPVVLLPMWTPSYQEEMERETARMRQIEKVMEKIQRDWSWFEDPLPYLTSSRVSHIQYVYYK